MAISEEAKSIVKGLNPAQKRAVLKTLKNPSLIIAGAGSGKTRVLTKRAEYLMKRGLAPHKLLTVTFTNKAAKEMRERISQAVGEEKAKKMMIGTFHSLAVRWLRRWPSEAGLKKNWTIFDTDEQKKLIKNIMKDLNMGQDASAVKAYLSRISNLKNDMMGPEQFRNSIEYTPQDNEFYKIYKLYQERLQRNNAVDFDDLIMKMVLVLQNDTQIRSKLQNQFRFVMVDEYQDTNECQYQMIKLIVGDKNNLFVVGDDFQGIYGWRGADLNKILEFEKDYPGAKIIKLEQNYRSTQTVVNAANELMKHNEFQMDKVCFSEKPTGEKIKIHVAYNDEAEAEFVANEIRDLVDKKGYDYKEVAILYRTNVLSRLLEDQFIYKGIPYNMVSGFSFYERKEIKDTLAWIQLSVNPDNDMACERVLDLSDGIGATTIKTMKKHADDKNMSLYEVVERYEGRTTRIKAALAGLTQTVEKLNVFYEAGKNVSDSPISDMLDLIFKYTSYIEKLREKDDDISVRRLDNVLELQKIAKGYEFDNKNPDIQDFLDSITLTSQQDKTTSDNEVQMMTLHASKGLEYKVIFVIGVEEGLLPHAQSRAVASAIEEERRLAYVGLTRAEERCYWTRAIKRMDWSRNYTFNEPSRFIENIPDHLKEEV